MPSQSRITHPTLDNKRFTKATTAVFCFFILVINFSDLVASNLSSYVVKKGDTLSTIAEQTGIGYSKTADIARANNIDNMNLIFPGQVIELDSFTATASPQKKEDNPLELEEKPKDKQQDTLQQKEPEQNIDQEKEAIPTKVKQINAEAKTVKQADTDKHSSKLNLTFSAGLGIGQSFLDVDANSFEVSNQTISLDIDDSSLNAQLFLIMSLNKHFGMELALNHLGAFEFTGVVGDPANIGTSQGELTFQAISLSAHYKKRFEHFDSRFSAGVMQMRQQVSGDIDLVGTPAESIDNSENSSNAFVSLEASREIYKTWSLGPQLSWINSGDPIQSISIRLFRPVQ